MKTIEPIHGWDEKLEPIFSARAQMTAYTYRCISNNIPVKVIFSIIKTLATDKGWKIPSYAVFCKFIKGVDAAIKIIRILSPAAGAGAPEKAN